MPIGVLEDFTGRERRSVMGQRGSVVVEDGNFDRFNRKL